MNSLMSLEERIESKNIKFFKSKVYVNRKSLTLVSLEHGELITTAHLRSGDTS